MKQSSYFKLYNSLFENESYVDGLTDLQKVLLILVSSELNRKEAETEATKKVKVMKFSHWWLSTALSLKKRSSLSIPLKEMNDKGIFDYTKGFNVSQGRSAPSMIRDLQKSETFIFIDRYTLEVLLYEKVKKKEMKYRHIIVYALCQYIQQFEGGSVSTHKFGHMLGFQNKRIEYRDIKKPLEDLKAMNLISFQRARGKIEGVQIHPMELSREKRYKLRESVRIESDSKRTEEQGAILEVAATTEEEVESMTMDSIIDEIKEFYFKLNNRRAVIQAHHKQRFNQVETTLPIQEIYNLVRGYLQTNQPLIRASDDREVFGHISNHLQSKMLEKFS